VGRFACDLDVFTGLAACCNLLGAFFGQELMHGHAIDSFKTLNLAFSMPAAAGDQEGCMVGRVARNLRSSNKEWD
jgi:hypothetical protein